MDFYSASGLPLLWSCFFQTIAISWIFGADKFCDCVHQMMGIRPNKFWYICWVYLAPAVMVVRPSRTKKKGLFGLVWCFLLQSIFIFFIIQYEPIKYGDYQYPTWAEVIGIGISLTSMVWIPAYAIYYVLATPGSIKDVSKNFVFVSKFDKLIKFIYKQKPFTPLSQLKNRAKNRSFN